MDICTLVVITTINAIACAKAEECSIRNGVKYCIPMHAVACLVPEPFYDCVKANGTKYSIKQSEIDKK